MEFQAVVSAPSVPRSFDVDLKTDAAEAKKHRDEAKKYLHGAKKDAHDAMEALSSLHDDLLCLEYEFKKLKERPVQESAPVAECAGESFADRPVLDQLRQALSDAKCHVENAREEADKANKDLEEAQGKSPKSENDG